MSRGRGWLFAVWVCGWLALAAALWAWAVPRQLAFGCWVGEWPFEEGCEQAPTGKRTGNPPQVFVEQLQANVGDGRTYAWLTRAWWTQQDPRALQLLPAALRFNPYHPQVMAVQAEAGLKAQDWPMAAEALVNMVTRGHLEALPALTAMMADMTTQGAVLARLTPESRWLDTTLAGLDGNIPVAALQPFVSEGTRLGILKPETSLAVIDRMKQSNEWLDAYLLWVASRGEVKPGLYNGGFDTRSLRRGFDWEWPDEATRGGGSLLVLQASAAPEPGGLLEVEMTARRALPQPMVSQAMVLFGPEHVLRGRYMGDRIRSEGGLVWAFRCAAGGERFAQSPPLKDTQRKWLDFEVRLQVPAECRGAVRLQLEAAAPWEANAGMAGVMAFDDFELRAAAPGSAP